MAKIDVSFLMHSGDGEHAVDILDGEARICQERMGQCDWMGASK
jgi:hypothetical protein